MDEEKAEVYPMRIIEPVQQLTPTAMWQVVLTPQAQQPMIVQYVYSNTTDMNWM